jgi:tetratricopeptide (TPR) repeat protein
MGLTYFALGRHEEAIDEYKKAIEIDPNYLDAHYNLAIVYGKG